MSAHGISAATAKKPQTFGLKHSKLSFAELRKRKTAAAAISNSLTSKVGAGTFQSSLEDQPMSIDMVASQSLLGSLPLTNSGHPAVSQAYEQTQMDPDQGGENVLMQDLLANRVNKLDKIKDLDKRHRDDAAKRVKQDKDRRLQEKFKTCEALPEDWSLKTEIDLQMPLLKSVDNVNEILNYKDVAR